MSASVRAALDGAHRGTMATSAAETLRELIVMGEIPAGTPLRLEDLADRLGMSISPVREAVRQLESLGLAEHAPYKGARVTAIDAGEMHDVYEVRLALETLAVRHAATRWDDTTDAQFEEVLGALSDAYAAGERAAIIRGNTAFHDAIAQVSGSRWLPRLLRPTLETSERFSAFVIDEPDEETYEVEERGHRAIVAACRAHDADEAERTLTAHLAAFAAIFERDLGAGA